MFINTSDPEAAGPATPSHTPPFAVRRVAPGLASDISLAFFLAWYDVRHRYARSVIGPFWITLQTAIFVACIGLVFSAISGATVEDFMPYFAVSFVLWSLLAGATTNATTALLGAGGFIKDRGLPGYVFFIQCFFRHLLFLAHNIVVPVALFLTLGGTNVVNALMAIPGLLIFFAVTACLSLAVGALATRYRDVQPLVESLVTMAFLASPIMWKPDLIAGRHFLLDYNPVVHLLAVWREPLLEGTMPWHSFLICAGILATVAAAAWFAMTQLRKAAFWI